MVESNKKRSSPCGSWPSLISPEMAASASGSLDYPLYDGEYLYWIETRPEENGRNVLMRVQRPTPEGMDSSSIIPPERAIEEVLPSALNIRSRVHEYGGRAYTVKDGIVYFVLNDDQCVYRLNTNISDSLPERLSPADQGFRFAELCIDSTRQRLIAVGEHHSPTQAEPEEPENFIASIPLDASCQLEKLVRGADFYAYPCLNTDASCLAFISWLHPNMPWDNTSLNLARFLADGSVKGIEQPLVQLTQNSGGEGTPKSEQSDAGDVLPKPQYEESILNPLWAPDNGLFFISDRSEWWNLYYLSKETLTKNPSAVSKPVPLCPVNAEFATPLWTLGMSTYGTVDSTPAIHENRYSLVTAYSQDGLWHLGQIDLSLETPPAEARETTTSASSHALKAVASPYTQISSLTSMGNRAWFIGSSPCLGSELAELNVATGEIDVLRQVSKPDLDAEHFSKPEELCYPTTDNEFGRGFYYPPHHPRYRPLETESPPLIALCHGGPTGATSTALSYKIQFWTSRGFAVADFNYRGSTGFGRRYRNQLRNQWGCADVEDVITGVKYLCAKGLADPDRLLIRGSSAGGYTVLAALTFSDIFRAGASLYGIGDLETLARDTHKFEARYLDSLIGPYPEARQTYIDRSPIHHIDKLRCPVIFFQGLIDKVVPPNQALAMVNSLKAQGLEVAYVPFPDEGHGFRKAANIARVFREELAFYQRLLDLPEQP